MKHLEAAEQTRLVLTDIVVEGNILRELVMRNHRG